MSLRDGMDVARTLCLAVLLAISSSLIFRVVGWVRRIHAMGKYMPVVPVLFPSPSRYRPLLPKRWQVYHMDWPMKFGQKIYEQHGSDIFALVSLFEHDKIFVCNPESALEIKVTRADRFQKDTKTTQMVLYLHVIEVTEDCCVWTQRSFNGRNDWRFHRRIAAQALPPKTLQLVHTETIRQTNQMMALWEKNMATRDHIVIENLHGETLKLALYVISGAAYGCPFDWEESGNVWPGHQMPFAESLRALVDNLIILVILPRWMLNLPFKRLRETRMAYNEFGDYVRSLIDSEKHRDHSTGLNSVLKALVDGSTDAAGALKKRRILSDDELLGNAFLMLLAGHETTYSFRYIVTHDRGNVLMFAMTHLALHPNVQEQLYQEIQLVCGNRLPLFTDLPNLMYALCIMYETMRLHPVVGHTSLTVASGHDEAILGKYPVPKDAHIGIDFYNLHRNKKYWGNTANNFDPRRFDNRNKDLGGSGDKAWYSVDGKTKMPVKCAFLGFSDGPRACLGRRFAETEFLTCLVMVAQRWTIHLKPGWTEQQARDLLFDNVHVLTLQPASVIPLVFKKR